ncbi:hypothetical protein [Paenibacillus koleovorans]|uniref:hypothetical protein n=1 Tax=Paenibacillus koleovorans TaxID=121608 RepID=UPI000FDBF8A3|nr:hypothetical protein [Paenibacillus koleovorans]
MTGDGYPVELGFTSGGGEAIRYTVECAGPEVEPCLRLDLALAACADAAGMAWPGEIVDRLRQAQAWGRLEYGTWISGRHGPEGDAFKLYVEVPAGGSPAAEAWARDVLGDAPLLPSGTPMLRMIGVDAAAARIELYYRAHGLQPWEVRRLLGRLGLASQADALLDLVEALAERSATERLPFAQSGFSLSLPLDLQPGAEAVCRVEKSSLKSGASAAPSAADAISACGASLDAFDASAATYVCNTSVGYPVDSVAASAHITSAPAVFSLFAPARSVIGPDGLVRQRLLDIAARRGWPLRHYAAVSAPLADRLRARPAYHGLLSFIVAHGAPPQLHVGLRPPPFPQRK